MKSTKNMGEMKMNKFYIVSDIDGIVEFITNTYSNLIGLNLFECGILVHSNEFTKDYIEQHINDGDVVIGDISLSLATYVLQQGAKIYMLEARKENDTIIVDYFGMVYIFTEGEADDICDEIDEIRDKINEIKYLFVDV